MFAIEIHFTDGVSQSETILVRRPQALIGADSNAHVVIDDMKEIGYQLRVVRDLGRSFRVKPVGAEAGSASSLLEGVYEGETFLDVGRVRLHITALDVDLILRETEPPDRAGVRVLRQSCSTQTPLFPAVVVPGIDPMVISFVPDQPIYVGRSNQCAVRLDSSDISARHARMGFEAGEFWVEDLGSTNGTYVRKQQVSGRVTVPVGEPILLGRDITVFGVTSEDQIQRAASRSLDEESRPLTIEQAYPVMLSVSEVARPARMVIGYGAQLKVGRDPGSDMWLGAPHVSRTHCVVEMSKTGALSVTDTSTNGTAFDGGILKKGDVLDLNGHPKVFNFGGGVTVALCFNEDQEKAFLLSHGSPHTYLAPEEAQRLAAQQGGTGHGEDDLGTKALNDDELGLGIGPDTSRRQTHYRGIYRALPFSQKLKVVFLITLVILIGIFVVHLLYPVFNRGGF